MNRWAFRVKPAAGVFLGLGAGCAVVVALDADSEARRRAAAWRRQVLTTALRRRLHGEATAASPAAPGSPAVAPGPRFYVVTGPDARMTSLGRESVSHSLLYDRAEQLQPHGTRRSDGGDEEHDGMLPRRPARLAVPYDLKLGTGQFCSLVEQQVLRAHDVENVENGGDRVGSGSGDHDGSEPGAEDGMGMGMPPESDEPGADGADGLEQQLQQHQSLSPGPWGNTAGEVRPEEVGAPPRATAAATVEAKEVQIPPPPSLSTWESLVLWATLVVLDGQQRDDGALWALERALSGVESEQNQDDKDDQHEEVPSPPAGPIAHKRCNFVLEMRQPATAGGGAAGERSEPGAPCGDLARFGWSLASLGLGSVVVR